MVCAGPESVCSVQQAQAMRLQPGLSVSGKGADTIHHTAATQGPCWKLHTHGRHKQVARADASHAPLLQVRPCH